MAEITRMTEREVALLRVPGGQRVLMIGGKNYVDVTEATRVIAHTHPSGVLEFSEDDIRTLLKKSGQKSSVVISPSGEGKRLAVPLEEVQYEQEILP